MHARRQPWSSNVTTTFVFFYVYIHAYLLNCLAFVGSRTIPFISVLTSGFSFELGTADIPPAFWFVDYERGARRMLWERKYARRTSSLLKGRKEAL
ncbi:hypothetical protein BU24DRAFT_39286 [Aaosphaeria arxii CBS 175.79]|uniref:Uncharacterized protein n=1 Tax=Aaosphaeria arxii CBS 175.79 TaxID=1450172 RepID=A0A6A5YC24_9PLEO|nr:uncharacterized protein BU24DRAFT_39286 [Aaosphaeria arxii CBS 175.79]KAF2022184.1 hypothetical protein BU24DRAFT_39286 [Aaosphaeria arxii CBS 175.79]